MKIREKITNTFLIVFILIFIITALVVGIFTTISMANQAYRLVNISSITKAEHLRSYLNSQKEVVTMLGASTVFRDLLLESTTSANFNIQKQRVNDRLARTILADKNINELFLIDKNAKVIASTNKIQEGVVKSNDTFFSEGQKNVYIKEVYFSETIQSLAWGLAAPITNDKTGEFLGVIAVRINIDSFFQIIKIGSTLGKTGESFLLNKDKYFLTPSFFLGNEVVLKKKIDTQNARDCFDPSEIEELKKTNDYVTLHEAGHNAVNIYRDYRNVVILGTHAYIPETNWCLITKVDEMEIFGPIITTLLIFIGSSILGIIVFLIIGSLISKKITQPIEKLHKGVEIISGGDLNYKVSINSQDEIGDLSREFDKMTGVIKQSRLDVDRKVEEQTKEIVEKAKDMENQQKAILNILEDVEEEKQKVGLEKDKIDAVLHSIGDGVFVVNNNLEIVLINQIALDMAGYSFNEAFNKKYDEILNFVFEGSEGKVNDKFIKDAISTGKVQEMSNHTQLISKNGRKIGVSDSAAPLLDSNGKTSGCVVVFRDVTRERDVDRMKTEFISLASHQLRTPLSAMKWFSEMLLNGDAGKLNKEQGEFVTNISQSNERMIALVNSLLNISRIESGRIIVDPKPTDLKKLIEDVISEIKNQVDGKKQEIIISIHSDLPKLNIDPKLTREIYKNLLTNANKYTKEKGEISIMVSIKDDYILSQVSDNGFGIPEKDQRHIFEKFYRADNIVKLETEGTGLGLYLAKSIVESSGGKIWFKSKEGEGTTFWFTIPLAGVKPKTGEVGING